MDRQCFKCHFFFYLNAFRRLKHITGSIFLANTSFFHMLWMFKSRKTLLRLLPICPIFLRIPTWLNSHFPFTIVLQKNNKNRIENKYDTAIILFYKLFCCYKMLYCFFLIPIYNTVLFKTENKSLNFVNLYHFNKKRREIRLQFISICYYWSSIWVFCDCDGGILWWTYTIIHTYSIGGCWVQHV